jgi:hypothetical protein
MFSTLRNRFGIPGVISVIALVFAMLGGAYAANNSGSAGKATASAKAKKGPRGPKGATGPAGPAGPAGAKGDTGANGTNGSNGSDGAKGATGATGPQGLAGATGATGPIGPTGPSGGGGGGGLPTTLGSGETETGTYAINGNPQEIQTTAISFPIPLKPTDAEGVTRHTAGPDGDSTCLGTVLEPSAPEGFFCRYVATGSTSAGEWTVYNPDFSTKTGVGSTGALIQSEMSVGVDQRGSWAVTAP